MKFAGSFPAPTSEFDALTVRGLTLHVVFSPFSLNKLECSFFFQFCLLKIYAFYLIFMINVFYIVYSFGSLFV